MRNDAVTLFETIEDQRVIVKPVKAIDSSIRRSGDSRSERGRQIDDPEIGWTSTRVVPPIIWLPG